MRTTRVHVAMLSHYVSGPYKEHAKSQVEGSSAHHHGHRQMLRRTSQLLVIVACSRTMAILGNSRNSRHFAAP